MISLCGIDGGHPFSAAETWPACSSEFMHRMPISP